MDKTSTWTIVMFPKIQIDTAVSYLLLTHFGEAKYPDIKNSTLEFWTELPHGRTVNELEKDGYILIDLGDSKYDHHKLGQNNNTVSTALMVARDLGIEDRPDLQKLLEFARRDDLEGKGTSSSDSIDKAFGLSGLLTALNKALTTDPHRILNPILTLLTAHFLEENKRFEVLPKEYESLKNAGKIKEFSATQFGRNLRIIYVESDNSGLAGYIRSKAIGGDLVIQRASTGHVNFVSKQQRQLQLKNLARLVKLREAEKNNIILPIDSPKELEKPGRTERLPHWFYDARANTLQNGGLNPQNIPPTKLTYTELEELTKDGLNIDRERTDFSKNKFTKGRGVVYLD